MYNFSGLSGVTLVYFGEGILLYNFRDGADKNFKLINRHI